MREAKITALRLMPGVVSDNTELGSKGRYTDGDKVRFRGGLPETINGWTSFNASGVTGTARGIHTWATLDGLPVVAAATESNVYAWIDGTRLDITPLWKDIWLGASTVSLSATAGASSISWEVFTPATGATAAPSAHNLQVGDVLTFRDVQQGTNSDAITGQTFTVTAVPSTVRVTGTFSNGASFGGTLTKPVLITMAFRAGLATGTGDTAETRTRVYAMDSFGEELVFCGSDGTPIFAWQPETAYSELLTNPGFSSGGSDWAAGTNWALGGTTASHFAGAAGNLSQNVTGVLEGGRTYEMSFSIVNYPGGAAGTQTLDVLIDTIPLIPTINRNDLDTLPQTFTFRFVCPPDPNNLIFTASADLNMDLDNASIKVLSTAFPINEAPQKTLALFTDPNRILVALGTVEVDGDFSSLAIRWCDQENLREWVPDATNLAGDFIVGKGSYLVGGGVVGERNLVLTNDTAYTMAFTGSSGSVFSITPIANGCGLIGRNAFAAFSGTAFWLSRNNMHMYDGQRVLSIECPVRDRIFGQMSQYQENKTSAYINVDYGEWWVHYPHTDDGTEISRYVTYGFVEKDNPWSVGTLNRTVTARAGVFAHPIGIDTTGAIWLHETGTSFPGTGIVLPYIETAYLTGQDGDKWVGCRKYLPDFDKQLNNVMFTINFKRMPQGQLNNSAYGPFLCRPNQEKIDFLGRGRQLKCRWASQTNQTQWRLGVVSLEMLFDQERK